MNDKKKELEERESQVPAETRPIVPGTEEEAAEDSVMPRLRLLQSTSTEVEEGDSKAGYIRHSLSGEEWETVEFIPLCIRKSRIHFDSKNPKGAPLCFAPDGKVSRSGHRCLADCPFDNAHLWKGDEPPPCDLVRSFPSLILKDGKISAEMDYASIPFVRSSTKAAQTLTYLRKKSGQPYWAFVYELSTSPKKFQAGTAYVFGIRKLRATTAKERDFASRLYHTIEMKPVEEEEVAAAPDDRFEK